MKSMSRPAHESKKKGEQARQVRRIAHSRRKCPSALSGGSASLGGATRRSGLDLGGKSCGFSGPQVVTKRRALNLPSAGLFNLDRRLGSGLLMALRDQVEIENRSADRASKDLSACRV